MSDMSNFERYRHMYGARHGLSIKKFQTLVLYERSLKKRTENSTSVSRTLVLHPGDRHGECGL